MTLHIAVVGSGPTGMTAAMLLARQGHRITLVDRDPGPVPDRPWDRVGVMQFHLPHSLRAPGRLLLAERLPDVHDALIAAGAEVRVLAPGMPEAMAAMHVRRSVLERTIWGCTSREPGVHRLTGHVDEVVVMAERARGIVVDGRFVPADLVVDASGRAGRIGAGHRPAAEVEPAGIAYATRMYQLLPGAVPGPTNGGPGLIKVHEGFMQLVFLHDQGTFSVLLVRAAADVELAQLRHEDLFEAALEALPESSAWTESTRSRPVGPVRAGSGLVNSYRGQATGVDRLLSIGDAVLTTNPAGARGLSLGMRAAAALADVLATHAPGQWGRALEDWDTSELRPWFEEHLVSDGWLRDAWSGAPLDPEGPVPWTLVLDAAALRPEWMRFLGPFLGMAAGPAVLDPLRAQVREMLRDGWRPPTPEGLTRDDLVEALRRTRMAA